MSTLIFDIETVGEKWDDFDEVTKDQLTAWIKRGGRTQSEQKALRHDVKDRLGLSPLTGKIVSLALYDLERKQGAVYYTGESEADDSYEKNFVYKSCGEEDLLRDFWEGVISYDTFVTFNGRAFDVPFIINRSVACNIAPTKDLAENRYLSAQKNCRHVDLLDQFTNYGAMGRRPSLHMFCRAFGIDSPKTKEIAGYDVSLLYEEKQFKDIANYNIRDVVAITELYQKWYTLLAPESFKVID